METDSIVSYFGFTEKINDRHGRVVFRSIESKTSRTDIWEFILI